MLSCSDFWADLTILCVNRKLKTRILNISIQDLFRIEKSQSFTLFLQLSNQKSNIFSSIANLFCEISDTSLSFRLITLYIGSVQREVLIKGSSVKYGLWLLNTPFGKCNDYVVVKNME